MRKIVIPLLFALMLAKAWAGSPLLLVSEAESRASEEAGGLLMPRTSASTSGPKIELLAPDVSRPVSVPTRIDLRFAAPLPAEPNPETFKALYGAFRLDITRRLLGSAKEGISVPQAMLPAGKHQLILSLTDTMGRESQQLISFVVQ
jgi:hypothetical protein